MRNSMPKNEVLALNRSRSSLVTPNFVFKLKLKESGTSRIAFAFSRKSGTAVLRNRFKRRLRELVRGCANPAKFDVLCIARGNFKKLDWRAWQTEKEKIRTYCERL